MHDHADALYPTPSIDLIDQLQTLWAVSPPGRWRVGGTRNHDIGPDGSNDRFIRGPSGQIIVCASEGSLVEARTRALQIVAAVNAMPELLERVQTAEREVARLRKTATGNNAAG